MCELNCAALNLLANHELGEGILSRMSANFESSKIACVCFNGSPHYCYVVDVLLPNPIWQIPEGGTRRLLFKPLALEIWGTTKGLGVLPHAI